MSRSRFYVILWLTVVLLSVFAANIRSSTLAQTIAPMPSAIYLPVVIYPPQPTATPIPTATPVATPTPPLPPFDGCQTFPPTPVNAPNYPVKIVDVDKTAMPETVQLKNVSNETVDLTGWRMCSVLGTQEHKPIGGVLGAGEARVYKNGEGNIWRNDLRDDGALYDELGQLVSYWNDLE